MFDGLRNELKPLSQLDPLLLPLLVYICPYRELSELFSLIPTYLSVAYLNELVNHDGVHYIRRFTKNEVSIISIHNTKLGLAILSDSQT